jgi:hypothetical protein
VPGKASNAGSLRLFRAGPDASARLLLRENRWERRPMYEFHSHPRGTERPAPEERLNSRLCGDDRIQSVGVVRPMRKAMA